jgi:predicted nucleotidyltransferase
MIQEKYLQEIKRQIERVDKARDWEVFVFGSSLEQEHFGDIDLGVQGSGVDRKDLIRLKEFLEESNLPFFVDVVNFNEVSDDFRDNVMEQPILWLKR